MNCPLCNSREHDTRKIYLNDLKRTYMINQCKKCRLMYLPDLKKSRKKVYGKNYSVWGADEESAEKLVEKSKKVHFRYILSKLLKEVKGKSFKNKTLLDIGTGKGYLLEVAKDMGFKDVYGLELSKFAADIAEKKFPGKIFNKEIGKLDTKIKFDIITMTDLVEHLPDIRQNFSNISKHLKQGGYILITTPNTGSITRTILGKKWFQYKFEHVVYFNKQSMRTMLKDYDIIKLGNNTKSLDLGYYKLYLKKYSAPLLSRLIPQFLEDVNIKNPLCGELLVIARKAK